MHNALLTEFSKPHYDICAVFLNFVDVSDCLQYYITVNKLKTFGGSDWIMSYLADFLQNRYHFAC